MPHPLFPREAGSPLEAKRLALEEKRFTGDQRGDPTTRTITMLKEAGALGQQRGGFAELKEAAGALKELGIGAQPAAPRSDTCPEEVAARYTPAATLLRRGAGPGTRSGMRAPDMQHTREPHIQAYPGDSWQDARTSGRAAGVLIEPRPAAS
jgi:hypothetical protein